MEVKDITGIDNSKIKQRLQAVQQDWTSSFKTIAHKANKKARAANRKARKVLGTEDGRPVRNAQVYNCNLNLGYDIFKRFQKKWIIVHNATTENASRAVSVDEKIYTVLKQWQTWEEVVFQFHRNVSALPDVVAAVEIAQSSVVAIGDQIDRIDDLLVRYEDILERVELVKVKEQEKLEISQLVEIGQIEYQKRKEKLDAKVEVAPVDAETLERQSSIERQQTYEDAFLEQMNRFVASGQLDEPIAGVAQCSETLDRITIDESDVSALKEFLGPEELSSVIGTMPEVKENESKPATTSSTDIAALDAPTEPSVNAAVADSPEQSLDDDVILTPENDVDCSPDCNSDDATEDGENWYDAAGET